MVFGDAREWEIKEKIAYIKKNKCNIYGTKRLALPVPKLVVFYNGLKDTTDEEYLYSLSDINIR